MTYFQDDSDEARRLCYTGADIFVVCFSVVKPDTFRNVQRRWIPELRDRMGETPIILIGTQADLRDDESIVDKLNVKGQRPINAREAVAISRRLGTACYLECSPVMKKRMKQVMNDAFVTVFSQTENYLGSGCTLL